MVHVSVFGEGFPEGCAFIKTKHWAANKGDWVNALTCDRQMFRSGDLVLSSGFICHEFAWWEMQWATSVMDVAMVIPMYLIHAIFQHSC